MNIIYIETSKVEDTSIAVHEKYTETYTVEDTSIAVHENYTATYTIQRIHR